MATKYQALRKTKEAQATAHIKAWEDRFRDKTIPEIVQQFNDATNEQKSELLLALVLQWAARFK